ncbi:LexA family transcriptional regulator [uncultured Campylobacter sp.]|uniref:XRE family transcriptional regulator n=1 Tax=uncultured Campylobacter sp. TaxID=218934 RepID=UPI00262717D1|nr:LexA family transcriptional regulator [uncultured Campylobacter sp.]
MNLGLKIKNLREERGLTQLELANLSGISRASIQLYEADKVEIPVKKLSNISRVLDVDADFFIKDKSSLVVRKSDENLVRKSFVSDKNTVVSRHNLKEAETDQIFIRKLSSSVGAGESVDINGIEIYDTDVLVPFSRMLFKVCPKNTSMIRCMRVEGYSMVPMLYPDSWVIADVTAKFEGDGLYIVNYCDHFMVKLLQKSPDGVLHIKSVNKEYDSYEIGPDSDLQVYIVGKVLRCVI